MHKVDQKYWGVRLPHHPKKPLLIIDGIWWATTSQLQLFWGMVYSTHQGSAVELRPSCLVITGSIIYHYWLPSLPCIISHPTTSVWWTHLPNKQLTSTFFSQGWPLGGPNLRQTQSCDWSHIWNNGNNIEMGIWLISCPILRTKISSISYFFTDVPRQKLKEKNNMVVCYSQLSPERLKVNGLKVFSNKMW